MDYGGWVTLLEAFTVMDLCNRALYQHDAPDLTSLLEDSSKFRKTSVMTTWLAEAEGDTTLLFGFVDSRAILRRIVFQAKNMPTTQIIRSESQLFLLTIQRRRLVNIYQRIWNCGGKLLRSPSKKNSFVYQLPIIICLGLRGCEFSSSDTCSIHVTSPTFDHRRTCGDLTDSK